MEHQSKDVHLKPYTIGQRVANLRKSRGETQADLAQAIEVTQSTISKLEQDSISPKALVLNEIAKHYSVDINYFTIEPTIQESKPYVQASIKRPTPKQDDVRDTIDLLSKLIDLKEKGAITDEEFDLLKSKVMDLR